MRMKCVFWFPLNELNQNQSFQTIWEMCFAFGLHTHAHERVAGATLLFDQTILAMKIRLENRMLELNELLYNILLNDGNYIVLVLFLCRHGIR